MKLLKNTNLKRIILIIASMVLSGAAIWFFKDTLIANYFGEKSISATHQFSIFLLISISMLLGWAIIYNLLDYLFPDNLVAWLKGFCEAAKDNNIVTFERYWLLNKPK